MFARNALGNVVEQVGHRRELDAHLIENVAVVPLRQREDHPARVVPPEPVKEGVCDWILHVVADE